MIILHATERSKPFVWTSTGFAIKKLEELIDSIVLQFEQSQWRNIIQVGHIGEYSPSDIDIIIFEGAYMETNSLTTEYLRKVYPNAKLVCLGSDSVYFVVTEKNGGYQFNHPKDCDLFLDQMTIVLDKYSDEGVNCDRWMWTGSKPFFDYCEQHYGNPTEKKYDLIGVYAPHTLERGYRGDMIRYLVDNGLKFTQGSGTGHNDTQLDKVLDSYSKSWFTLGTSSHDNPVLNDKWCVKGWRDFIGPFMNAPLIYDNNPDIEEYYCKDIPKYQFGNFEEISEIVYSYQSNIARYKELIEKQKQWARENTIEIQLVDLFEKHGITATRKLPQYQIECYELERIIKTINDKTHIPYGDIYEFGVYGGNTLKEIRDTFLKFGINYKNVYGFDSFRGLPEEDTNTNFPEQWKKGNFDVRPLCDTWNTDKAYKDINNRFPFDTYLIKCWYKDLNNNNIKNYNMTRASFINIDCDLYISALQALDFMFSNNLIQKGTVIRFDDMGGISENQGEKKAKIEIWDKYKVISEEVYRDAFLIKEFSI